MSFTQDFALDNNLDIVDLHILDYMMKWFSSGFAVGRVLGDSGYYQKDVYYLFSQNKLIEDLPILHLQLRAVQKRLKRFEDLNIIRRKVIDKKLWVNFVDIFNFM